MKKLIYIQWADATSPNEFSWFTEESAIRWAKEDNFWIEQVGWILEENEKYLLLASRKNVTDFFSSDVSNQLIQYGQIQKIPKTWIRKRKQIKQ